MKTIIMQPTYLLILGFLILSSCSQKAEQTKPVIGKMTESVYASVTIQPVDMYDVFATIPGILEEVFIEEGDTVKKDQILAQVTASNPKINIESALLNLDLARENYKGKATILSSIAEEISSSEKQLRIDSLNFHRQHNLWTKGVGSKYDMENMKLKYDLTKTNLDILRKRYAQTNLELENSYKQSQNALKKAQSNLSDYYVRAKMDGKVYALLKEEGELISQQDAMAQIGKSNSFVLELLIDEVDIARIIIGQLALITLDAYEGKVYESIITKIYPLKDNRTQTFMIEAHFAESPKVLYAGLSGEANITISESDNTISIPLEYLLDENKVKTADGELEVETGMKSIDRVEIVSGIDTATVILKP